MLMSWKSCWCRRENSPAWIRVPFGESVIQTKTVRELDFVSETFPSPGPCTNPPGDPVRPPRPELEDAPCIPHPAWAPPRPSPSPEPGAGLKLPSSLSWDSGVRAPGGFLPSKSWRQIPGVLHLLLPHQHLETTWRALGTAFLGDFSGETKNLWVQS